MSRPWRSRLNIDRNPSAGLALLRGRGRGHVRGLQVQAADGRGLLPAEDDVGPEDPAGQGGVGVQGALVGDQLAAGANNLADNELDSGDDDGDEDNGADEPLDSPDEDGRDRTAEEDLLELYSVHRLSRSAMDHVISLLNKYATNLDLPTFRTIKKSATKKGPPAKIRYVVDDVESQECEYIEGSRIKKAHFTDTHRFSMRFVTSHITVSEAKG